MNIIDICSDVRNKSTLGSRTRTHLNCENAKKAVSPHIAKYLGDKHNMLMDRDMVHSTSRAPMDQCYFCEISLASIHGTFRWNVHERYVNTRDGNRSHEYEWDECEGRKKEEGTSPFCSADHLLSERALWWVFSPSCPSARSTDSEVVHLMLLIRSFCREVS